MIDEKKEFDMKNLLERIKKAAGRLEDCIRRFPFSFGMLCLIALAGNYMIISEKELIEYPFAFTVAGLFCFLIELAHEYGMHKMRFLAPAFSLAASALFVCLMKTLDNVYIYTAIAAAGIAAVSFIAFVLYRDRENRHLFSHIVKSAFIVEIFAIVVLSGISVCIAAFHFLIFNFHEIWKMESVGDIATVTVHIKKIREKIEYNTSNPQYIETIWGVGYRFKI